jgi:ribonuclease BN (tRNA processing enzyme)
VVRLIGFETGEELTVQGLSIRSFPLEHVIESVGYIISDNGSTFIYTGDTGPSELLWKIVNENADIRALIVETSFPNELQNIADVSGHYTPQTLARDLEGLQRDDVIIYIHHLKPNHYDQVQREIEAIGRSNIIILRDGQVLNV